MISVQSYNKSHIKEEELSIIRSDSIEKILTGEWSISTLCKDIAEITHSKLCCILLSKREPEDSDSIFNIVFSTDPSISLCKEMPILSLAFEDKIIVVSNNVKKDPRNNDFDPTDSKCPIKKFCGIPILKDDVVYGQIVLCNRSKGYRLSTVEKVKKQINLISNIVISQDENFVFGNGRKVNDLRFLSSIAHEIRTPIHGIVSMISLVGDVGPLNEKQQKFINCALSSCEELIELVKDSIDFQKIKTGSLGLINDTFDIYELFDKTIELIRFKADRKKLYLTLDIDSKVPKMVYGDKDRMRQILINIIGNAVKFTQTGGVKVYVQQYPSRIIITIKDTGCGIRQDNINKIFVDYYQEENHGKSGMGLGLSLSRRLIQMMGGEITVESLHGKGSTFTIDLPLNEEHYQIDELSDDDKKLSVLVIDDHDNNRIKLRNYLKQWKIDVDTSSSFKEAKSMVNYSNYDIFMINPNSNMGEAFTFAHFIESTYPTSRIVSLVRYSGENSIFDAYIEDVSNKTDVYNKLLYVKQERKTRRRSVSIDKNSIRVCIVEDDEISGYALKEILLSCGIKNSNVTVIDNGEQAVRDITHSRYDLIFMDCKLKTEMNGIKVTKIIRENVSDLKIYGVTAAITDEEKTEWLNSGLDGLIFKPFKKEMIIQIIETFV